MTSTSTATPNHAANAATSSATGKRKPAHNTVSNADDASLKLSPRLTRAKHDSKPMENDSTVRLLSTSSMPINSHAQQKHCPQLVNSWNDHLRHVNAMNRTHEILTSLRHSRQ